MKVNIVFSMKAKTQLLNVFQKLKLSSFLNVISSQKPRRFGKIKRTSFIAKSSKSCEITRQIMKTKLSSGYEKII